MDGYSVGVRCFTFQIVLKVKDPFPCGGLRKNGSVSVTPHPNDSRPSLQTGYLVEVTKKMIPTVIEAKENEGQIDHRRRERRSAILRHSREVGKRRPQIGSNSLREQTKRLRVCDLQAGQPISRLELLVLRRYPRRHVSTERYEGPVAAACGRDESGVVGMVLWGEQVDSVRTGDVIRLEDGWCRMSQGELVVSSGKTGSLAVLHA